MAEPNDPPIACSLGDAEFRERRANVLSQIGAQVLEVKELNDGYAYRFPSGKARIGELANFITLECACCPFLRFNLLLEPAEGPIWLELTGPTGTKVFLESLFGAPKHRP